MRASATVSVLLMMVATLSACATSPPIELYTLIPTPPTAPAPPAPLRPNVAKSLGSPPGLVRLARVRIPGEIDRRELVQRREATRLTLAEQHHWAAPLGELIERVLERNLETRLGGMANASAAADPSQRTLSVDIRELLADASCHVTLRAEWTLAGPSGQARQGSESIEVAPGQACGIAAVPMTMSRALAVLSDRIAAALTQ